MLLMLPASTENDALVDPPGTVAEAGTVSGAFLVTLMSTVDPPLGAAADSVTVHTADACEASVVGLHARLLTVGGAAGGGGGGGGGANCKETLCEVPLSDATRVTVVVALTAAAVALNAALAAP